MFTISIDDYVIYNPLLKDVGRVVMSPKLTLEVNKAGSLEFDMLPDHPEYSNSSIKKLSSTVYVYRDNELMFRGRILNDERDLYLVKHFYCEGDLSFLIDSQLRPCTFTGGLASYFTKVIAEHNQHVQVEHRFTVGQITLAEDPDDESAFFERTSLEYMSSLDAINKNIIETNGGYVRTRTVGSTHYIDLLADYEEVCTQTIEFGKNLLDLSEHISAENLYTVIIPLGAEIENEDGDPLGRINISSVNSGNDYLENSSAIALFGRIEHVVEYDEIEKESTIKKLGKKELAKNIYEAVSLSLSAIDLNLVDISQESINIGFKIRVVSPDHGIDSEFLCTKVDYDLVNPDQNTYEFSSEFKEKRSISERVVDGEKEDKEKDIYIQTMVSEAKERASELINSALGGYVWKTNSELYIMDTDNIQTATSVWRWNVNGLGYWSGSPGGALDGVYDIAITSAGEIVADFITVGMLQAERIQFGDNNAFEEFLRLATKDAELEDKHEEVTLAMQRMSDRIDDIYSDLSGYRSAITNDPSTGELVIQYANPETNKVAEIRLDGSMIKFYVDGSEQMKAYISADGFVFERGILTDALTIGEHWMWTESKSGTFRLIRSEDA